MKYVILIVAAAIILLAVKWAFLPAHRLPATGSATCASACGCVAHCRVNIRAGIWPADPFVYAVRTGLYDPGQGCTVYGRTAAELAAEIASTEADAAARAARRERLPLYGR